MSGDFFWNSQICCELIENHYVFVEFGLLFQGLFQVSHIIESVLGGSFFSEFPQERCV